jgi:Protein of unknown function (DUF789)
MQFNLNPYVLPFLPVPDHHGNHHHIQQQQTAGPYASPSAVAPFLFQLNVEANANATNAHTDRQSKSICPSTSRVILPCYLLPDRPEAPTSSSIGFNSTVNLIADTIIGSIKGSSSKGNSSKDNDEKHNPGNTNSKKGSRKNSKKKKNRKKGGAKTVPSEIQIKFDNNMSKEPCASSDSSSGSSVETSLSDGDLDDQRVKSNTDIVLKSFSSALSNLCHGGDVNCPSSTHSSDEDVETEQALLKILEPANDAVNEVQSAFEETNKADMARCSSDMCVDNDFIPVVSGRRGRYSRRFGQQGSNPSRFAAFKGYINNRFSTRQEKPSKTASEDKLTLNIKHSKLKDLVTETSMDHESLGRLHISNNPDSKPNAKPCPSKAPNCSRKNTRNNVSKHSGEYVFKKDDFPSLPLPNSDKKEVTRHKVSPRMPGRDDSKKLPISLPLKVFEECKQSKSEDVAGNQPSIQILEVKIGDTEKSSIGSGSSSGGFFSPNSSKSSQLDQSRHAISGLDSTEKLPDHNTQLKPEICPSTNGGQNISQSSQDISLSNDNSTIDVAQSGCDTCPSSNASNTLTDIDDSRFGSSVCSCPTITTPMLPSNDRPCNDIGELKNMPIVCGLDMEEIVGAVWTANRVHQIAELVQATFAGPLADYELLCHYAAPTVNLPPHQIANVPLQKIWRWYEKPSCYALEVKGCLDHQSLEDFTAHFVPSLSALQLFVQHSPSPKLGESQSSEAMKNMLDVGAGSADLVFEYFEHEQPYLRRTFFEK